MAAGDVTATISRPTGKALYFDGVNDRVELPFKLTTTFTVMVWVYSPQTFAISNEGTVISNFDAATGIELQIENTNDLYLKGAITANYTANIPANEWHMVGMWCDGTTAGIIYDGVLHKVVHAGSISNIPSSTHIMNLGARPGAGPYYIGTLDKLTIHGRALSESDILKYYKNRLIGKGITGYWSFNNETDSGHDDSNNGNDGTVTGAISTGGHNTIEDDIKTARVTANDKYNFIPLAGNQVMMAHIEEA